MEGWKNGRMEEWKDGSGTSWAVIDLEGCSPLQPREQNIVCIGSRGRGTGRPPGRDQNFDSRY